jgi:hypothetical protein
MILTGENRSTRPKTCPSVTSSTTNLKFTGLQSNPSPQNLIGRSSYKACKFRFVPYSKHSPLQLVHLGGRNTPTDTHTHTHALTRTHTHSHTHAKCYVKFNPHISDQHSGYPDVFPSAIHSLSLRPQCVSCPKSWPTSANNVTCHNT